MTASAPFRRADIVAHARQWIGTPYHHQASTLGAGVDCIGLVRGVWRTLYGQEPERLPGYGRDWSEATGRETLLEAAKRHFIENDLRSARAGDVLVFRYRAGTVAKHAGILATRSDEDRGRNPPGDASVFTFIHAMEGAPVTEAALSGWWQRRIAGVFQFPGIID
ncbi:MAG: NlpC/P60 family protein [Hyphomicrobiaceae bacterium]